MHTVIKMLIALGVLVPALTFAASPYTFPGTAYGTVVPTTVTVPQGCPALSIAFERGARDSSTAGQVSEFQKFISTYYTVATSDIVTGYFGPTTQGYAIRFQKEMGLPSAGYIGGLTRAAILKICSAKSASTGVTQPATNAPSIIVTTTANSDISVTYANMPAGALFVFVNRATAAQVTAPNSILTLGGSGSITVPLPILGVGSYYIAVINATGTVVAEGRSLTVTINSINQPSCSITADKGGYLVGDSIALSYTSKNATSASWSADSLTNGFISLGSGTLAPTGTVTAKALAKGTANISLTVTGQEGTGLCTASVIVSDKPLPSCTLVTDKLSYKVGDLMIVSWSTKDATGATWAQNAGLKFSTGAQSLSGAQGVALSTLGTVTVGMNVTGAGGTNFCSTKVNVSQ